jgi:hypothetical protein
MVNEEILLKANIMGGMNEYIKKIGDDDIYYLWVGVFPDSCTENQLMKMAEDDEFWKAVVNRFADCLRAADLL